MNENGWYPRRRGAGDHLATGRISLFDDGVHDFLCMNAQARVDPKSSVPAGVWMGSAKKIWLLTARQCPERAIQRSLQKLERIGWVKRWKRHGQRGDYPMQISKFVVTDLSGEKFLVNAEATIDWKQPVLEPCTLSRTELSPKRHRTVTPPTRSEELQETHRGVYEKAVSAWNENCGPLPKVKQLTSGRQEKIRTRLSGNPKFLDTLLAATRKAATTRFLCGGGDRGWKATFDWMIGNDENATRVLEGAYDDTPAGAVKPTGNSPSNELSASGAARLKDYGVVGVCVNE